MITGFLSLIFYCGAKVYSYECDLLEILLIGNA